MKKVAFILQMASPLVFMSSFFVEDNKKAVKRRWVSVGLFAAGYGIQLIDTLKVVKK